MSGSTGAVRRKSQNTWAWARPENQESIRNLGRENKEKFLAPSSEQLMCILKWPILEYCSHHSDLRKVWWAYDSARLTHGHGVCLVRDLLIDIYKRNHGGRENSISKKAVPRAAWLVLSCESWSRCREFRPQVGQEPWKENEGRKEGKRREMRYC